MTMLNGPVCARRQDAPTYGFVEYSPNLGATYAYLIIFCIFLLLQLGLGIRHKTWFFCGALICGLILEIVGYAGRLLLRTQPCELGTFLM